MPIEIVRFQICMGLLFVCLVTCAFIFLGLGMKPWDDLCGWSSIASVLIGLAAPLPLALREQWRGEDSND